MISAFLLLKLYIMEEEKTSQVWRFPKKYAELFKNISNEDTWIIIKELFFWNWNDLIWLNKAYYDIIKVDLDNLEKSACNWIKGAEYWKLWWRPKKTPQGIIDETPQGLENKPLNERESKKEIESKYLKELETILWVWNETYKTKYELTDDLKEIYSKCRKKYNTEEIKKWLINYADVAQEENYKPYRLSLFKFLKQSNWLVSYINW